MCANFNNQNRQLNSSSQLAEFRQPPASTGNPAGGIDILWNHTMLCSSKWLYPVSLYINSLSFPWFSLGLVHTCSGTIQSINPSVNNNSIKINKGMKNKQMKDFPEGWGCKLLQTLWGRVMDIIWNNTLYPWNFSITTIPTRSQATKQNEIPRQ